jgi:hypothetical protein
MMGWMRRGVSDARAWQAGQAAFLVLAVAGTLILGWMRFLGLKDPGWEE